MNRIQNPGFEADWGDERSHSVLVIPVSGIPEIHEIGNIFSPPNWLTWFYHEPGVFDQPECRDAHKSIDARRVRSGEKGMLFFTFFRAHWGGFLQQVSVEKGKRYRATGWAHAWSNHNGDGFPHPHDGRWSEGAGDQEIVWPESSQPSDTGDQQQDAKANFTFRVGIDPTGGANPMADGIVWGYGFHIYNGYVQQLSVEAVAQADTITVFLSSKTLWAFCHSDAYWDDAELVQVGDEPPEPPPYECTTLVLPQDATRHQLNEILDLAYPSRRTFCFSNDDSGRLGGTTILYNIPLADRQRYLDWYAERYPQTAVEFAYTSDWNESELLLWQCDTQWRDYEYAEGRCSTLCAKGCWIVDCAMAQRYFDIDPHATPLSVDRIVGSAGYNADCEMTWATMPKLGLEVVKRSFDDTEAKAWLAQGGLCFAEVQPASLLHHVLITRYDGSRYWMLDPWRNVEDWLDEHYAGVESWRLVREYQTPIPPPSSEQLISLHLQKRVSHDVEFVAAVQPTVVKTVLNMEFAHWIKDVSPDTLVIYRQWVQNQGQYWEDPDPNRGARRFLETHLDSLQHNADVIDYVESLNETIATGDFDGIQRTVAFDVAFCEELEKAMGDAIRPSILTAAVGNPQHGDETRLLVPAARASVEYGGVLGYHSYWLTTADGYDSLKSDWKHFAGRALESWDPIFRAEGIYPQYVFGECGAYATAHAGWKHEACLGGDLGKYLEQILYFRAKLNEWNAAHGGRCLGSTFFTSGGGSMWASFDLAGDDLRRLAEALIE